MAVDDENATLPSAFVPGGPPGARIAVDPRYDVGPVIGRGGMGEIRIARDTRIGREVAIKLMRGSVVDDESVARFFREARVQGALEHPALCPVHDLGLDAEGNPYFVMKKLSGITLASVLDATASDPVRARFPRRLLLQRLVDVAQAVVFAHSRGVIHRDLKPANLMLGEFGEAYVLDWGLARIIGDRDSFREVLPLSGDVTTHTAVGALLGTPGYMSPEQARGEDVDQATDVFALGTILYEVLAGASAMPRGLSAIDVTLSTLEHRPSARSADIPPELDDLCAHATAQDRRQRPNARTFVDRLEKFLDGDRDEERRRVLGEQHAVAAEAAYHRGDEGRTGALQQAGRALALDPTNARAGALLTRLLLEPPKELPPQALVAADRERVEYRNKLSSAGGIGFIGVAFVAPTMCFLEIRHLWPIIALVIALVTQGLMMLGTVRLNAPLSSRIFLLLVTLNVAIIALFGLIFGPLMLAPLVLTGSIAGWLLVPTTYRASTVVALHVLALVPLLVLEQVGVLPSSFHVEAGSLVLTPWAVAMTPVMTGIVMTMSIVGQQAYLIALVVTSRRAATTAQNRIHAMKWHLEQVFSRGAAPSPRAASRPDAPSPPA